MEYCFDTNTIIHLIRGTPIVQKNKKKAQSDGSRFIIPPVVNYEILRGLIIKPISKHEKAYAIICENCSSEEMTVEAWECAARIYAELYEKHLTVEDADIMIAAFCMVNDYTLVTANTKDFENIDGLQLVNWAE